jgi:hypothetical protein
MGNRQRTRDNGRRTIVHADSFPEVRGPWPAARKASTLAVALLLLTGCAHIEPWVKPYEREALADPIMSFDPHPISTHYIHHVYEAREGARGALGGSGGGCGCL